jgi:hypothetical protein
MFRYFILLFLLFALLDTFRDQILWIIAVLIGVSLPAYFLLPKSSAKPEKEAIGLERKLPSISAAQSLASLISSHKSNLAAQRDRLLRKDAYGNVNADKWEKEKRYFLENVVKPKLGENITLSDDFILDLIERASVMPAGAKGGAGFCDVTEITPLQYESFCGDRLRALGWDVSLTAASGDQGVDVLARKGSLTVALQCKKYETPVGNKAVQEVLAGARFYDCQFPVVVSNAAYTEAAQRLAGKVGVLLLHHEQLKDLEKSLSTMVVKSIRLPQGHSAQQQGKLGLDGRQGEPKIDDRGHANPVADTDVAVEMVCAYCGKVVVGMRKEYSACPICRKAFALRRREGGA